MLRGRGGAGQYSIGLRESTCGSCSGQATWRGATMTVTDRTPTGTWRSNAQVTLWNGTKSYLPKGCGRVATPAPPRANGKGGAPALFRRGAGPNEVSVTIDDVTCSSTRAVVLYDSLGTFSENQGALTG